MNKNLTLNDVNTGVVYRKTIGTYHVHSNGRVIPCAISTKLRRQLIYPTADPSSLRPRVMEVRGIDSVDPVAIGDRVEFVDAGDGTGMIVEVMPRKSRLVRPDLDSNRRTPEWKLLEQVIVANIDQVVPVFSIAKPNPKWGLLDRYLVSAESLELPVLICITKMDLSEYVDKSVMDGIDEYERIGYPVALTSAKTGEGIERVKTDLRDKSSVLIGKSGVGKTTLLNVLQPGLGLRVNEVSKATGKGKHTTTHLEMFPLEFGGSVVDTPGMREFGLWQVDNSDLALFFPEMRPFVGLCKFGLDCSHTHEPECAIKNELESGKISPRRYQSYRKMLN